MLLKLFFLYLNNFFFFFHNIHIIWNLVISQQLEVILIFKLLHEDKMSIFYEKIIHNITNYLV